MDLSCNSELLTYARFNADEIDVTEDSFVVLERDDSSPVNQSRPEELLSVSESGSSQNSSVPSKVDDGSSNTERFDDDVEVSVDMRRMLEENTELKRKVREQIEKLQEMNTKFAQVVESLQENKELKRKISELQQDLAKLNEQLKSVQPDSHETVQVLQAKLAAKEETLLKIQELYDGTTKRLKEVEELWNNERAQTAELKDKLRFAQRKCDAETSNNNEHMQALKIQVEETQAKLLDLNAKLIEKDDEVQELRSQLESSELTLEEFRMAQEEKRAEISALNDARAKTLAEVEALHAALATKSTDFHELHQNLVEKEQECASLREKLKERDEALRDLTLTTRNTEEICSKYQIKVAELVEEVKLLRNSAESGDSQELLEIRNALRKLDRENATLRTQVAALSTENESIEHWRVQCETYRTDYERVVSEKANLESRIVQLTQELLQLRERDEKREKDQEELHQRIVQLTQAHVDGESDGKLSQGNQNGSSDDIVNYLLNQVKKGVSVLWDSNPSVPQPSTSNAMTPAPQSDSTPESVGASSAPPNLNDSNVNLPPCPVCGKKFLTLFKLERHCEKCGENRSHVYESLDPFVFVPGH